ncbi:uncharacterized protein LOC133930772 isoform X2 [Phragmites australis]|nr:uncharacterized protein LOC133930772 isoform X2 [Phragmites australis]
MVKAQSKEYCAFGGAIFLCNHLTRKECFERKIFGLAPYCADFVEKVKAGTTLFLFDVDQRKLHGVFEATSDGAVNIIPDAYISIGQQYPSQIRFKRIWFCEPLMEGEFQDAVRKSFSIKNKFSYGLSHQQVAKLLHLFSSRNRLQCPQNPRLQDDVSREFEISSLVKETDMQSSPNSSSCGSFRSPCQTCSSSTLGEHAASLGHKLIDPMSLGESDISNVAKSNSSKSPLHTGADVGIVTIPSNQEAMDEQPTDDYIPLPQEEDALDGVDDLFGLLEDERHSSEYKGSSDSEDHTTFHQTCVRKGVERYPPMVNSKLRSDSEGRKSVFSRLVRAHETFSQRKRSKTNAFPPRSAESFNPLSQRKKQWRAPRNRPIPCHNDGMLDMPSTDRLSGVPALDYSFFWSDNGRSTKFSGVHESSEVSVKEEMRTPSLNFKQHANDSNVGGGDQDFDSEDVEEAGRKKMLATASFHQEYPSDTVLVPKGTKAMDILAISDGNCKEKSISLSSKGTYTQVARPYMETNGLLQDEQWQSIQGCFEYGEGVTSDTSLILESSKTMDSLAQQTFGDRKALSNDETGSHVAASHLGTETSFQEKQTQSVRRSHRVVNSDEILLLGKFETMYFLPNHVEDCGNKRSLPSDGSDRLVASCHRETEMSLLQKQTPNDQSCSEVVHDDKVLVPEISEVMFLKFDADSGNKGTSLGSDYREEVYNLVRNCHEVVPSDVAPVFESCGPLSNFPILHGDSANKNSLLEEASKHLSTGHQDTAMLLQDEHYHSCCGDTSSVLEYSTVDTSTGDEGSEHKNSFNQKDEVLFSVTGSEDRRNTTNAFSSDRSRSCAPTKYQECSKLMMLKEEQYQNFQSRPELAPENSNSMDFFAVSAEGFGSRSGLSADRTSGYQVADLLGTNSESRTSFVNDSSSGSAEAFSTSALGSENVDHNVNGSEVYAEPPILQHDPGEATKFL